MHRSRTRRWACFGGALALVLATIHASAPARAADASCPLGPGQKVAAVKAFKALSPLFQDPRCLNCHGAVNPFSKTGGHEGGWIDIREEARRFLATPGFENSLTVGADPTGALRKSTTAGIEAVAKSPGEIADNDLVRLRAFDPMQQACRECHVPGWVMPLAHNRFTGRDWKAMCVHVKTSSLTNTPVSFLRHMQDDEQVLLGFAGRRGLSDPVPPKPPAMSAATAARHANAWVAAMGAAFHQPPECGCETGGLALSIDHRMWTDPNSSSARIGYAQFDGEVRFDIVLAPEPGAEGWWRGEVGVERPLVVRHVVPSAWKCSGKGTRSESWLVSARLDSSGQNLRVDFGFEVSGESASWTCTHPLGGSDTRRLDVRLHGELVHPLTLPARDGASARDEGSGPRDKETISITVVEMPSATRPGR